jgi:hypothetical protein
MEKRLIYMHRNLKLFSGYSAFEEAPLFKCRLCIVTVQYGNGKENFILENLTTLPQPSNQDQHQKC